MSGASHCATKSAIEGLIRILAQKLPESMAVVRPYRGIVDTDRLCGGFGGETGRQQAADQSAVVVVSFPLGVGPVDNGKPLTGPR